jgi:hypothetical protein
VWSANKKLTIYSDPSANGKLIDATPDCPEVYFLYGFRNPTRTLFDFGDEQAGRTDGADYFCYS